MAVRFLVTVRSWVTARLRVTMPRSAHDAALRHLRFPFDCFGIRHPTRAVYLDAGWLRLSDISFVAPRCRLLASPPQWFLAALDAD